MKPMVPKPLYHIVRDIVYLLGLNGNTREYQLRKLMLSAPEQQILKKLKQQQAKTAHKKNNEQTIRKLETISLDSSSTSSFRKLNTQYHETYEDEHNVKDENDEQYDDKPDDSHYETQHDDKHDENNDELKPLVKPMEPIKKNLIRKQRRKLKLNKLVHMNNV